MGTPAPGRVWVVSELYHPELTSTGHFLTRIAEGLAASQPVGVLAGQPTYSSRGQRAPRTERRNGVDIVRCSGTTFPKDVLPLRLVNAMTLSASVFLAALARFRRGDAVIVVTNPPFLPFLVALAARLRGARCALLVHDVYPEVLVATGLVAPGSWIARVAEAATRRLYRGVDRVVVIGRDMRRLVERKLGGPDGRVVLIPNWADVDEIAPSDRGTNPLLARLGISDRVVLQYSGNMGLTHGLETVVAAAERLRDRPQCHFLLIGAGGKRRWVEEAVRSRGLVNVTVLDPRPRAELAVALNACDASVIPFLPGMAGVSVPSRMYNVLAAGKPIVAVADEDSELALLVREHGVGWVVPPGDVDGLVRVVSEICDRGADLVARGRRAREVAERECAFARVVAQYRALVDELLGS